MLAAIWLTAVLRKLLTGSVPGLVMISLIVLTVQTVAAIATGNLLIFLVHFPIANLALCLLFARTARGHSPIAARLADEVIGLRCPAVHQPRLNGFFQGVTVLWAGVFLLLAVILGVLLATVPVAIYVPIWAADPSCSSSAASPPPSCGCGRCCAGSASGSGSRARHHRVAVPAPPGRIAECPARRRHGDGPGLRAGPGRLGGRRPAQHEAGQDPAGAVAADHRRPGPAAVVADRHRREPRGIRPAGGGAGLREPRAGPADRGLRPDVLRPDRPVRVAAAQRNARPT